MGYTFWSAVLRGSYLHLLTWSAFAALPLLSNLAYSCCGVGPGMSAKSFMEMRDVAGYSEPVARSKGAEKSTTPPTLPSTEAAKGGNHNKTSLEKCTSMYLSVCLSVCV